MKKNIKSLVGLVKCFLILISGILLISLVSATDIQVWQGKYLTGDPVTTYTFNFTVYDDIVVGNICWSSSVDLTTDADRWWYTERTGILEACSDTSENYYLNININGADQVPRRLLKHLKYVDLSLDVNFTNNVNFVGNLTLGGRIKFTFEQFIDNLVDGWLRITGNLNVTENITADYFIGNGSQLTSVCLEDGSNCPVGITDTQKNTSGIYLYNDTTTIYFNESQLNLTIDDRASGDNATWNQSFADTLYAPNTTAGIQYLINSTNILFTRINATDWTNVTITESQISDLVHTINGTNINILAINATDWTNITITESQISNLVHTVDTSASVNCSTDEVFLGNGSCMSSATLGGQDNSTWNQSLATTLYSLISEPLWSGNQSLVYLKSNPDSYWNATFALFNKTYADTLYSPNTTLGIQSLINSTNILFTRINATDWTNVSITEAQISDLQAYLLNGTNVNLLDINASSATIHGNLNVTENITADYFIGNGSQLTSVCLEDGSNCPSGFTDTQKNTSGIYLYNDTETIYFNESQLNLTIDDRASGLGDNTTWNQSFADTLYAPNTTLGIQSLINSTNILFARINATDWTNVSITEAQISDLQAYLLNGTNVNLLAINATDWTNVSITESQISDLVHTINGTNINILAINATDWTNVSITESQVSDLQAYILTETDPLWSGNQSLVYLKSNPDKYWNATFALFNKSYADTLYLTSYSETDPLWSGNQSLVYLKSNPDSYWNATFALFNKTYADVLYSTIAEPLWSGNKTNVAFKNEANVFTAGQSLTGQNITAINCIIFDSGGKICSA